MLFGEIVAVFWERERERERKEEFRGGVEVRDTTKLRGVMKRNRFCIWKVPRHCPLVLLIE
jgi:hypothetical protein